MSMGATLVDWTRNWSRPSTAAQTQIKPELPNPSLSRSLKWRTVKRSGMHVFRKTDLDNCSNIIPTVEKRKRKVKEEGFEWFRM